MVFAHKMTWALEVVGFSRLAITRTNKTRKKY